MSHWVESSFFYHIYPLGFCAAPEQNDFHSAPSPRLEQIHGWLDHIQALGANALYLGPLFESTRHGYDTADYYHVDRRLGEDGTLQRLSADLHARGMRLVLDGVFNHVGRDFWAFRDVLRNGSASPYCGWFQNLTFSGRSPFGDPFTYESWAGHYSLVKLNLRHPDVRNHLFHAVETWMREFGIDGLRLDAADSMDFAFLGELAAFCRGLKPDFYLFGEVVHGDYRRWAGPNMLDATTNYEIYKSLYSSHVDANYFELAYALNRQFGDFGLYRGLPLYNFADNHDVDRVASNLKDPAHLYPLHLLLFTIPGVPSIYYGSEWGIQGARCNGSDRELRPSWEQILALAAANRDLEPVIARLAQVRRNSPALARGSYRPLHVAAQQLAFMRESDGERVLVISNAAAAAVSQELSLPSRNGRLVDLLNPGISVEVKNGRAVVPLDPCWGRILRVES
jgi:cyclomaltodextrinase / maltogenic alpha-amylase / neopullulanase